MSEKLEHFDALMAGDHALIHLDTRKPGVQIPEQFAAQFALTLKLSYAFQGETTRDEKEIRAYLKFDGEYELCVIPWDSVWGMTSEAGEQRIWPSELPKELALELVKERWQALKSKLFGPKTAAEPDQSEKVETQKKKERKGGHLKVVK